jgi:hypothetical protein
MAEFKRSRLVRKSDETVTKKTVFMGFLTILFAVFILVFGLPFLIKFSVLLGDMKKNNNDTENKTLPPLAPRLVIPFEATNSATIGVSGFAEAKVEVELFKNEVSIGKTTVTESGDFAFEKISLDDGENNFSAVASSEKTGAGDGSTPIVVVYDKQAPNLKLTNPSESSLTVDYADFDIIGESEKNASISVNGRLAVVDDEGKFKLKIQLNTGKNDVEVIARDDAGNETKSTVAITYSL